MGSSHQVVIVGGGIAGASIAYWLTEFGVSDVLLLEGEPGLGYHASGRSAALFYDALLDAPDSILQAMKVQAGRFYRSLPAGFSDEPILDESGALLLFNAESWPRLVAAAPRVRSLGVAFELLSSDEVASRYDVLDAHGFAGGVFCLQGGRLDVHQLLSSYVARARERGCEVRCGARVDAFVLNDGRCCGVEVDGERILAGTVVNAAGAWAGTVGERAGAAPVPLTPCRRSAILYDMPTGVDVTGWPFIGFEDEYVYFEPESGGVLMSPMDETPMDPCDAQPDEMAIARGVERLRRVAPRMVPRSARRRWAGLRTFAADRNPVVGEDPRRPGFFWLAGQGGHGIVTSPVLSRAAAELLAFGESRCLDVNSLRPERFL